MKNTNKNQPHRNESQEMVLAQLPENLHAHSQSDMQVICTGAFSWKKKGDPFLERKVRGGKVTWKISEMRAWRTKEVQQCADVSTRV